MRKVHLRFSLFVICSLNSPERRNLRAAITRQHILFPGEFSIIDIVRPLDWSPGWKKKTDLKTCVMKDLVSEDWNCCFFVREFYCILTIKTNLPRNPPHQNGLWKVTERKFSCLLTHPLMFRVCRNVNMQTFPQSAMKEASAQLAPIGRPSRPFTRFPALYPSEHRVYSQQ